MAKFQYFNHRPLKRPCLCLPSVPAVSKRLCDSSKQSLKTYPENARRDFGVNLRQVRTGHVIIESKAELALWLFSLLTNIIGLSKTSSVISGLVVLEWNELYWESQRDISADRLIPNRSTKFTLDDMSSVYAARNYKKSSEKRVL